MTNCSQCGAPKKETNHWFFGWLEREGRRLCIVPWAFDPMLVHEPTVQRLCGDSCIHKFVQQFADYMKASS